MAPKEQNLRVIGQDNNGNGNGNGNSNQTEERSFMEKVKIPDHFLVDIHGQKFIKYEGLLYLGKLKGLVKLTSEIIKYPQDGSPDCVCMATLTGKNGEYFQDIGDANFSNVNAKVARHYIRVSSTRAKSRCLRDYLGEEIQYVCIDEIDEIPSEYDKAVNNGSSETKPKTGRRSTKASTESQGNGNGKVSTSESQTAKPENGTGHESKEPKQEENNGGNNGNNNVAKMSIAQKKAIENLARRKSISIEQIDQMTREMFNSGFEHLTSSDASSFIQHLQQTT